MITGICHSKWTETVLENARLPAARRGYWHAAEPSLVRAELADRLRAASRQVAELRTSDRGPAHETRRAFGPGIMEAAPGSILSPPPCWRLAR
jgi:hypothetical protein